MKRLRYFFLVTFMEWMAVAFSIFTIVHMVRSEWADLGICLALALTSKHEAIMQRDRLAK